MHRSNGKDTLRHGLLRIVSSTIVVASIVAGLAPIASAGVAGTDPVSDALQAKAAKQGLVPVIVELKVAQSAGALTSANAKSQSAEVAQVRGELLRAFSGKGLANLKTSNSMPLVAFQATASELTELEGSGLVASVVEDHEVDLNLTAPPGPSVHPGTPAHAKKVRDVPGPEATSSNGWANQLTPWWDWGRMGTDKAYANGYRGAGQTVAVLDSGVDATHAWLSGDIVAQACFSTATPGYTTGGCPNGSNVQYGSGAARPCTYNTLCGHGTHVAQTAAGANGVASAANIIAVQVFHRNPTNGKPTYWESDLVWAMSYVYSLRANYNIAAVNMSLGGARYTGYCDNVGQDGTVNATYLTGWINNLKTAGIATVVASGNDNDALRVGHPACISGAISVGNTTYDTAGNDSVYGYVDGGSNSNSTLDLLAPGTDICSAFPVSLDTQDGSKDGVVCNYIGTSMATPHVAGAIAVLKAYRPSATVNQIQTALTKSGPGVYDSRNGITRTRINVWNALYYI